VDWYAYTALAGQGDNDRRNLQITRMKNINSKSITLTIRNIYNGYSATVTGRNGRPSVSTVKRHLDKANGTAEFPTFIKDTQGNSYKIIPLGDGEMLKFIG
jgi:hypothetical protein